MIQLTRDAIDSQALIAQVTTPAAGAVVLFLGTVREFTDGQQTVALDYEGYPEMAERKLAELEHAAHHRWSLVDVALVHRLGHLELTEASVAVAVSAAHRGEAFAAATWLIDTLKQVVPIWKRENFADGTTEWVHPSDSVAPPTETSDATHTSPAIRTDVTT